MRLAPSLNAPFLSTQAPTTVSTDPGDLPYYAVRSLLRMFAALVASVVFTFVYAMAAARLRRAEPRRYWPDHRELLDMDPLPTWRDWVAS